MDVTLYPLISPLRNKKVIITSITVFDCRFVYLLESPPRRISEAGFVPLHVAEPVSSFVHMFYPKHTISIKIGHR